LGAYSNHKAQANNGGSRADQAPGQGQKIEADSILAFQTCKGEASMSNCSNILGAQY